MEEMITNKTALQVRDSKAKARELERILMIYETSIYSIIDYLEIEYQGVSDESIPDFKAVKDYYNKNGIIPVSVTNCEDTIFSTIESNLAFRAWHDYVHIMLNAPFDRAGEESVCRVQQVQFFNIIGRSISKEDMNACIKILYIEINGQVKYYEETGVFPSNQKQFFLTQWYL